MKVITQMKKKKKMIIKMRIREQNLFNCIIIKKNVII